MPKWHTQSHFCGREGARWGYGGDTVRVRWGYCIPEGSLQCAILAHNPILAAIVNQQSLPGQPLLARDQVLMACACCSDEELSGSWPSLRPKSLLSTCKVGSSHKQSL